MSKITYQELLNYIEDKYSNSPIVETDINEFKKNINRDNVISILEEILSNEGLLERICKRTYVHALGFDKIVLVDLSKDSELTDRKVQLRLHIWDAANDALPIVESMHEHSFDFISTVLTGKLENQRFTMEEMRNDHIQVFNKLKAALPRLSNDEISFLNSQLEIVEAARLARMGSEQLKKLNMLKDYNPKETERLTDLTHEELQLLVSVEGHFLSNRKPGEKKDYKHILDRYVAINPEKVLKVNKGEYYFHPFQLPHRLYYDNTILNSTILITTPVASNPQGGSLQRPTYSPEGEKNYAKRSLSCDELKTKLTNYIRTLKEN